MLPDLETVFAPSVTGTSPRAPHFRRRIQFDDHSCAAQSARMVLDFFGDPLPMRDVRAGLRTGEHGTYFTNVTRFFRDQGYTARWKKGLRFAALKDAMLDGVALVSVDGDHAAVVYDIDHRWVYLGDPALSRCPGSRQTHAAFLARWDHEAIAIAHPDGPPAPSALAELVAVCPASGDRVAVPADEGEHKCPGARCGEPLHVYLDADENLGVAHGVDYFEDEHAGRAAVWFDCPDDGRAFPLYADDLEAGAELVCGGCGAGLRVAVLRGRYHVLHELDYAVERG